MGKSIRTSRQPPRSKRVSSRGGNRQSAHPEWESYRTLTEHIDIGVFRSTPGPKGKFLDVNPSLVKMLGFESKAELMRLPISHLYQDPTDRRRFTLPRTSRPRPPKNLLSSPSPSPSPPVAVAVTVAEKRLNLPAFFESKWLRLGWVGRA